MQQRHEGFTNINEFTNILRKLFKLKLILLGDMDFLIWKYLWTQLIYTLRINHCGA